MRELFIWYRVGPAQAAEATRRVRDMQAALVASVPGLQARLLVRAGAGADDATWMETYALPGRVEGIGPALEADIEARARTFGGLFEGGRHAEVFDLAG